MTKRNLIYPRRSNYFTSSIPHDIESKEEIANYFRNELQKLSIVSQKLMYWLEEFEENELRDYEIGMPNEAELNDSYRNLTIKSEEHTFELQSRGQLVCRLLLEKKNKDGAILEDDPSLHRE